MSLLEEFWYGNIEPMEYDTSSCKEYKKLLELIDRNEEKFRATTTDEQKELFEKYTNCVREYQTINGLLAVPEQFQTGCQDDGRGHGRITNLKVRLDITSKEVVSSLLTCALVAYRIIIGNNVGFITHL